MLTSGPRASQLPDPPEVRIAPREARAGRSPVVTVALLSVTALGTLLALVAIDRARSALTLVLGAAVVAVLVQPLVRHLGRWVPRGAAVAGVAVIGIVGAVAVVATVAWDVDQRAGELSDGVRAAVESLPSDSGLAQFVERADLVDRTEEALSGVAPQLVVGDDDPLAVAGWVSKVVVIVVLAAFMLLQGDDLLDATIALSRKASTRQRWHRVVAVAQRAGGSYVRRTIAVSVVHGAVVGVLAAVLELPGAISLGAWVALLTTVPILGGLVAWLPVVTIATAADAHPLLVGALGVVAIVVDWQVRRLWVDQVVRIGPLVGLLSIGVGLYTLGIPGAVIGLVAAAASCAVAASIRASDVEELRADVREDEVGEPAEARSALPRMLRLGAGAVVALFVGYLVFVEVQELLVWVVLGAFVGVGLDRPIAALARRASIARGAAVAVVLGVVVVVGAGLAVAVGPSVADAADGVVSDAPEAVSALERLPVIGSVVEDNDASARVEEAIATLPDRLAGSGAVERVVDTAGDGVTGLLWTVAVMLAVLLDGPRLVEALDRRVPVDSRRRARRLGRAAYTSLANVAAAAAFVAVLNGTVVFVLALALGVPLAPVLGIWAALWNFVPQVGGFVGAAPLVVLSLAQGPWHALAAGAIFVSYQTFENHVIQPALGSRAVRLPPLVVLVAVLIGGSTLGLVGAILAAPAAGVVKVVATELRGSDVERIEDRPGRVASGGLEHQ